MNLKLGMALSLLAATAATVAVALMLDWNEPRKDGNRNDPKPAAEAQEERNQPPVKPAPEQKVEKLKRMASHRVQITREGAEARDGGDVIATFRKGQELHALKSHQRWHLVLIEGKVPKLGWVPKKDCRVMENKKAQKPQRQKKGGQKGTLATLVPTLYWGGLIVSAIGGVLIFAEAVNQSILWAVVILFVPFAGLVFIFMYWDKVKGAFLLSLAGSAVCFGGAILGGAL
jgi:hypothetical protein